MNFEKGGTPAVLSILMNFQFNSLYAHQPMAVVTLYDDLTYQFRTVDEVLSVKPVYSMPVPAHNGPDVGNGNAVSVAPRPTNIISSASALAQKWKEGTIPEAKPAGVIDGAFVTFFRSNGYGFIKTQDGTIYYANIKKVVDDNLREQLLNVPYNAAWESLYIPCTFRVSGVKRPDAKYEEAFDIRFPS